MSKPGVKFSSLRHVLMDLGFRAVPVTKPHVGFLHDPSDLLIVLPPYRSNSLVAPHHLVYVQTMLDGKSIMEAEEFDRLVADAGVRHSPSS